VQKNENRSSGRGKNNNKPNTRSWIKRSGRSVFTRNVIKTLPPNGFIHFCVLDNPSKTNTLCKRTRTEAVVAAETATNQHTKLDKTLWWECFYKKRS